MGKALRLFARLATFARSLLTGGAATLADLATLSFAVGVPAGYRSSGPIPVSRSYRVFLGLTGWTGAILDLPVVPRLDAAEPLTAPRLDRVLLAAGRGPNRDFRPPSPGPAPAAWTSESVALD